MLQKVPILILCNVEWNCSSFCILSPPCPGMTYSGMCSQCVLLVRLCVMCCIIIGGEIHHIQSTTNDTECFFSLVPPLGFPYFNFLEGYQWEEEKTCTNSQTIQNSDDQLSQSGPRRSVLDQSACNGVHDSVIFTSAYWAFQCDRCHRKLGSSNQTHITDTLNPLQGSYIANVTEKQTQSRPTTYISASLRL